MDCKEQNYELIASIKAYPESGITFSIPMTTVKKQLSSSEFSVNESTGTEIPFTPKSAKITESSKTETAGHSYTVKLSWEKSKPDNDTYNVFKDLKENHKHLIITYFGGAQSLIRGNEDGYQFTYDDNEGVLECELSLMNVNGIQRVL